MEKSDLVEICCEELRKKMVLGKRCGSNVKNVAEELELGLGLVRYTRSMSGKRISISSNMEVCSTVMKKLWTEKTVQISERSLLEALPQDILIRILCGVGHDDLKQLFHVSKQIRKATLIVKQWHFAYSTPKKVPAFRNPTDFGDFEEAKTPNAPKHCRSHRTRLSGKKLADSSIALFALPEEEPCSRRDLFIEMET